MKCPLTSVEILHICNFWILLRKIVIYLVGRKCHLRRLFCWLYENLFTDSWIDVTSVNFNSKKSLWRWNFRPTRYITIFLRRIQIPQTLGHFKIKKCERTIQTLSTTCAAHTKSVLIVAFALRPYIVLVAQWLERLQHHS